MKTMQIIELLYDCDEKYNVLHDFKKEVSDQEVSDVMWDIVWNMRHCSDSYKIKDQYVYLVTFEDEKLMYVNRQIDVWDNQPVDLIEAYREDRESTKEFIDDYMGFIVSGFLFDCPFDGGYYVFEYLGFTEE